MDNHSTVIYGLELPSRALCPRHVDNDVIQFMVGTHSVTSMNQIHVLTYNDEISQLDKTIYNYPYGEIWSIASSPICSDHVLTSYSTITEGNCEHGVLLFSIPDQILSEETSEYIVETPPSPNATFSISNLNLITHFEGLKGRVIALAWDNKPNSDLIMCLDESSGKLYKADNYSSEMKVFYETQLTDKRQRLVNGCFNPHLGTTTMFLCGDNVIGIDYRTMESTFTIIHPHGPLTRDIDVNSNKPYFIATGGDDCMLKFWDIRNYSKPVLTRKDHSHWIWGVNINPYHDQLVLTCGSDSTISLVRVASIASDPISYLLDEENQEPVRKDALLMKYDSHEDSVYSVKWSSTNSWVFASLSYDGRLVINHVPHSETLQILL